MSDLSLHLAPNAPWLVLALLTLAGVALAVWAYAIAIPPLPAVARRALPVLRALVIAGLLWLLAQPVLEMARAGAPRIVVLLDRSHSMDLPAAGGETREQVAENAVETLRRAWRGRAHVTVEGFAGNLESDSASAGGRASTALGDALAELGASPGGEQAHGIVIVSDGAVNAGRDPVAAARALGVPVHAVLVGNPDVADRAIAGIESSTDAQVGRATPVRVRVWTREPRGTPIGVTLRDGDRVIGRTTVFAPGSGAEAMATFDVTPTRPGLAVWTAVVDTIAGEIARDNNAREVAIEVAPGRLGVRIFTRGLNWDLTFLRRALAADSSLSVVTWERGVDGWRSLENHGGAPDRDALRGVAVVVLDAIAPTALPDGLDGAIAAFVRDGGAMLAFGGPVPGVLRYQAGAIGRELKIVSATSAVSSAVSPVPVPEASDLLAWDDDPARGERAWRDAAPLSDVMPVATTPADRVLIRGRPGDVPLLFARRVGRGQALLVNGAGTWRWSLSGDDDLTAERGRRLWRGLIHWLAQPVQGEPLRVRPERWLTPGGEPVRLFATLQDASFRPVAGASVTAELREPSGRARRVTFEPRAAGSYVATVTDPPPGRYEVSARATRGGSTLGRATTEFAVDRWSLEAAQTLPDSSTLAAVTGAAGGSMTRASNVASWARTVDTHQLVRARGESLRLQESPWAFMLIVGLLSVEWAWRRRRGLP